LDTNFTTHKVSRAIRNRTKGLRDRAHNRTVEARIKNEIIEILTPKDTVNQTTTEGTNDGIAPRTVLARNSSEVGTQTQERSNPRLTEHVECQKQCPGQKHRTNEVENHQTKHALTLLRPSSEATRKREMTSAILHHTVKCHSSDRTLRPALNRPQTINDSFISSFPDLSWTRDDPRPFNQEIYNPPNSSLSVRITRISAARLQITRVAA
jgi:hypothetical protein